MASHASLQECIPAVYQPIVPCASSLILCAWAAIELRRPRTDAKIQAINIANAKLLGSVFLAVILVAHLCWSILGYGASKATVAALAVASFAAVNVCWISRYHHKHATKPSSSIVCFLLVTAAYDTFNLVVFVLGDACEAPGFYVFTAIENSARVILLILECRSKGILLEDSSEQQFSPMETSNVLSTTFLFWLTPILASGRKRSLRSDDMPPVESSLRARLLCSKVVQNWDNRDVPETKSALVKAVFKTVKPAVLSVTIPRLVVGLFRCSQPLLIGHVIGFVGESQTSGKTSSEKLGIVVLAAFVYFGLTAATSVFDRYMNNLRIATQGALVSLIYHKALSSSSANGDADRALTLMSADVDAASDMGRLFTSTWGFTLETIVSLVILAVQVHWLFPIPVIMILIGSRVGKFMAANLRPRQKALNEAKQARISALNSVLSNIKGIKAMGMTETIVRYVQERRTAELSKNVNLARMAVAHNTTSNAIGILSPALTMILYTVVAHMKGENLDIKTMFTTLAVLATVTHPANMVLTVVPAMIAQLANYERIQDFLVEVKETEAVVTRAAPAEGDAVSLQGVTVKSGDRTILQDVDMHLPKGSVTVCCGKVGSGKSALARTVLGEMVPSVGTIAKLSSAIAYCDQTPWIPSGTVKEIICGYSQPGALSYDEIVKACCLDIDIQLLPNREQTAIGSRGINLSGGQKQRLAIARLLYAGTQVVVFDDSFAALDGSTETQVINNLFSSNGLLRKSGVTALWITNSAQYFELADNVIVLDGGRITEQGPWSSVSGNLSQLQKFTVRDGEDATTATKPKIQTSKTKTQAVADAEEDVDRKSGDLALYAFYLQSVGFWSLFLVIMFPALYSFFNTLPPYWIELWISAPVGHNAYYTVGYIGLAALAWVTTSFSLATLRLVFTPQSGANLHQRLLDTVFYAPLSFFTTMGVGSLLNRFSQDIGYVDNQLPNSLLRLLNQIFKMTMQVLVIIQVQKHLVFTVPITAALVYFVGGFYLKTSRQLRVLEIEAKAALFNFFAETIDGIVSIRAFHWQKRMEEHMFSIMDTAMKPNYLMACVQRWLTIVLELIMGCIAVTSIIVVVVLNMGTQSDIGVILNIILLANSTLLSLVHGWTGFEISLGAISRLKSIEEDTPHEDKPWANVVPPMTWPTEGRMTVRSLTAGYSADRPVLNNIDLEVNPGQKLVICGRTGSGKSTIFSALLGLLESSGQIQVDGLDITKMQRSTVRQRAFIAVPQEVMLLSKESLRFNLDPWNSVGDDFIRSILTKAGLWEILSGEETSNQETLQKPLEVMPKLSTGQSQLLAICRSVIQKKRLDQARSYRDDAAQQLPTSKPILLLDEATAFLDPDTESAMYDIIEEEFVAQKYTVIVVSHRLGGLVSRLRAGVDSVAVLAHGSLKVESSMDKIQEMIGTSE